MVNKFVAALGVCALVTAGVSPALAGGTPAQKCAAAKQKAAGKKAASKMSCFSKAKAKNLPPPGPTDPCLTKAEGKFSSAVAKADAKGPCPGTAVAIEAAVDACVVVLVADVPGNTKCSSSITKAAGKGVSAELSCSAKDITKPGTFSTCEDKADGKFTKAYVKAGTCVPAQASESQMQTDIDNCQSSVAALTPPTTSTSTTTSSSTSTTSTTTSTSSSSSTTTSTSSTTTTSIAACCAPVRIQTSSSPGTLKVGGFAPFPFPSGVTTVIDAGAADAQCKHDAIVPAGGFVVPPFCIPALQYTSQVTTNGCFSGSGIGKGVVWDGNSGAHGASPMAGVTKNADSSDGTCDPGSGICNNDDLNFLGRIVTTPSATPNGGVITRLNVPAHSRTWQDSLGCPGDGVYNPVDGDTLVTEFDFILAPTTGVATGAFVDMAPTNGCALPGGSAGFGAPSPQCAAGAAGPCTASGSPAPGPCCVVGQATTTATVGEAFSNSFPLYDLGFINVIPSTVSACGTPGSDTCVLDPNPCLGSASGAFVD
jgi:hypothetical protein